MPKPYRKHSLAHRRKIQAEGAVGFKEGRTREQNIYGYMHPQLRAWWFEGWDEASRHSIGKV